MIVTVEIDNELAEQSKKLVKESGLQWRFYIAKIVEKSLTELVENGKIN